MPVRVGTKAYGSECQARSTPGIVSFLRAIMSLSYINGERRTS